MDAAFAKGHAYMKSEPKRPKIKKLDFAKLRKSQNEYIMQEEDRRLSHIMDGFADDETNLRKEPI